MAILVLLRGGGDLASGVALRLVRAGIRVLINELPQPLVVRRLVAFAEAVNRGAIEVEGITARLAGDPLQAMHILEAGQIPVLVDPDNQALQIFQPAVLVDGRMTKHPNDVNPGQARLVIGLGPGFTAGINCHVAIETNRGHNMGRAIWFGSAENDTGIPEGVQRLRAERVLRAPANGSLLVQAEICDHIPAGQVIASVDGIPVAAPFSGVLRGILPSGMRVHAGLKIGDLDPRDDPSICTRVSDKSLAVGGGVLEAILSQPDLRHQLWD